MTGCEWCRCHRDRRSTCLQGSSWRFWPGEDGLCVCPMCGERLAPAIVVDHLGLASKWRPLTDADHDSWDVPEETASERAGRQIEGGVW